MRRVGAGLVAGLDLVEIFEFFKSVFVDGSDRFGQVSVHLVTAYVKVGIVVVDDPWEDGVLG